MPIKEDSLVGKTIDDRYAITELLGKGGMGVVYRARQRYLEREVALKVLRRDILDQEGSVKRFMLEARAASGLTSPHTVTVHDFGVTDEGLLYFTMELLQGLPLNKLIAQEGPLAYERAVDLTVQVCRSLAEAHEQKIWHRDMKPENIFITRTAEGNEHASVLDFGIAKLAGSNENLTATGIVCGTPAYLSPEQAQSKPLDHRSDLYSLGVVLYEMLAGKPPFTADTPVKVLMSHIGDAPPPVEKVNPAVEIPTGLARVLECVLNKAPEGRPASAEEFAHTLLASIDPTVEAGTAPFRPPSPAPRQAPAPPTDEERLSSMTPDLLSAPTQPFTPAPDPLATVDPSDPGLLDTLAAEHSAAKAETHMILATGRQPRTWLAAGGAIAVIIAVILLIAQPWDKPDPTAVAGDETAQDTSAPAAEPMSRDVRAVPAGADVSSPPVDVTAEIPPVEVTAEVPPVRGDVVEVAPVLADVVPAPNPDALIDPFADTAAVTPDVAGADLPAAAPTPDASAPVAADLTAPLPPEKKGDKPPRLGGPGKSDRDPKEGKDGGFVELKPKDNGKPRPQEDGDFIVIPK